MSTTFFPPLPDPNMDEDALLQWLQQQTISFQKIITGSLQAGNELSSSNFVSGSTGWQIDGDGNAEFNNVLVRGDVESGNWAGTSPADLSGGPDANGTLGYYLDSSAGAAQIQELFLQGEGATGVDPFYLQLSSGGSGQEFEGVPAIQFHFDDHDFPAAVFAFSNSINIQTAWDTGDAGAGITIFNSQSALGANDGPSINFSGGGVGSGAGVFIGAFFVDETTGARQLLMNEASSSASQPTYSWGDDNDSGLYHSGTSNRIAMAAGGSRIMEWMKTNTGTFSVSVGTAPSASIGMLMAATQDNIRAARFDFPTATTTARVWDSVTSVGGAGTTTAFLEANGDYLSATGSYGTISDRRLKDIIEPARSYLADLLKLPVRKYRLKGHDEMMLGFVADEVAEVFPGLVKTGEDGMDQVKTSVLVPMLITAVQELAAEVAELKATAPKGGCSHCGGCNSAITPA